METERLERQAERYAALEDPQRREIYLFVRRAHRAITREDVAAGVGVSRNLAAFHLERLLEAGLLSADYARPPGRSGPGAGRPAVSRCRSGTALRCGCATRHNSASSR